MTQIYGDVYKFKKTNGNESIIFVENTDEIFMFMTESADNSMQACMFLPLKKVSFDIESALKKNWTASDGDGGGYIKFSLDNPDKDPYIDLINDLDTFSLTLQNGTVNFSDVTFNDDGTITTTVALDTTLFLTNKILEEFIGFDGENFSVSDTAQITMTHSGNFLQFEDDDGAVYKLSFISDNELFLYTKADDNEINGEFVMKFKAN